MSNLYYRFLFTFFCLSIFGCKSSDLIQRNLSVKFLSEFIVQDDLFIEGTLVGGLSGIDFYNNQYYLVSDDSKNPRVYFATICVDKLDGGPVNTFLKLLNCWTLKYHQRGNINKPAALAAVANTCQCYSTNRQKPFIQINHFKC